MMQKNDIEIKKKSYSALLDKKGKTIMDSYVNRKYQQEMTEYVEEILTNVDVLQGVNYRLIFTPNNIDVISGHSETFEEFKEYYEDGFRVTQGVFEMVIEGDVSYEMLTEICDSLENGKSPFSIHMSTVTEEECL